MRYIFRVWPVPHLTWSIHVSFLVTATDAEVTIDVYHHNRGYDYCGSNICWSGLSLQVFYNSGSLKHGFIWWLNIPTEDHIRLRILFLQQVLFSLVEGSHLQQIWLGVLHIYLKFMQIYHSILPALYIKSDNIVNILVTFGHWVKSELLIPSHSSQCSFWSEMNKVKYVHKEKWLNTTCWNIHFEQRTLPRW